MREKRWRTKGALLLALVLALSGAGLLHSQAAGAIEVDRNDCSLTVGSKGLETLLSVDYGELEAQGNLPEGFTLDGYTVTVDLYRVAEVDVSGDYTAIGEFAGIDGFQTALGGVDAETSAEDWQAMAESAMEALASAEPVDTKDLTGTRPAAFTDLATGLYLVVPQAIETPYYFYTFTPYLVSLPDNEYDGTANSSDNWQYVVTMDLKAEHEARFGSLVIEKALSSMSLVPGSAQATFVFQVDIQTPGGETFQRIESLTFGGTGTQTVTIEEIPAGSTVTVEEIYTGAGYEPAGDAVQTVTVTATDAAGEEEAAEAVAVTFVNEPDNTTTGGYGVENHFEKDETQAGWYRYTGADTPAQ